MERKYIHYEGNIKVDVVEAKADATMDVQISVLGSPAFDKRNFDDYHDTELEAQGYTRLAVGNGSLFFTEGHYTYANGIEKSMGVIHENDDAAWDKNFAFYHKNGIPYFYKQGYIKTILNDPEVRGAMTGAFGLLNNGVLDISGAKVGEPSRGIYLAKSGRTIVGKKKDNTIVIACFDGVTGQSGLTGYETYLLAKKLGLHNAMCMDGGGSTFLKYKTTVYNDSSRQGANAVAIYIKHKEPSFAVGDKVRIDGVFTIEEIVGGLARLKEVGTWVAESSLQKEE